MTRCAGLRLRLLIGLSALSLLASLQARAGGQAAVLRYPMQEASGDQRYAYYWQLLQAALDVTEKDYGKAVLQPSTVPMNASRALVALQSGAIQVLARVTSQQLENDLVPIRIPLDKGLTGYRLFLVNAERQPELDKVGTLKQLGRFSIGQESRWVDVEILRSAGLTVVTGDSYTGLFGMLGSGRFDLLSRGVDEIAAEQAMYQHVAPRMVVERRLLLHYPLPRYYFTASSKAGRKLASRIAVGLERLRESGEFERRYRAYRAVMLKPLRLQGRRLLEISNPQLPLATPLQDKRLWDDLSDLTRG